MAAENKNILLVHLGLALAEVICWGAFAVEVHRALDGNTLSWAYVFEWPIFALYALYMWRRLLREERSPSVETNAATQEGSALDPALEEYNEYLRRVHHGDGAPPP